MERPAARYFCNKRGYIGSQSSHANCNYFACTTLEYQYIEQQERELTNLRARCERAETIATAARNLIAQKGRHNTEIAYKRVEGVIAKDRT